MFLLEYEAGGVVPAVLVDYRHGVVEGVAGAGWQRRYASWAGQKRSLVFLRK